MNETAQTREYARKLGLTFEQTHSSAFGVYGRVSNENGVLFSGQVEPHNQLCPMLYGYELGRMAAKP
mgnify:CR=1 FL=1